MPNEITERPFTLGAVLSAMTGKLLTDLGEVYEILSWLTGRSIYTHEIGAAMRESHDALTDAFPDLAAIDVSSVNPETWRDLLAGWVEAHGPTRMVAPLGWNRLAEQSPIDTLVEMMGEDRVIVVDASPEGTKGV